MTYLHYDRQIFGGVTPKDKPLEIIFSKELGVDYFLERRELGIINIGGPGTIIIDGKEEEMKKQDGYYIGKETKQVIFKSKDLNNLAKFYVVSTPAHYKYPNVKISIDNITPRVVGEGKTLNKRRIFQYIHPNVCESCQLQMGYTILEEGSAWNTMPCHTHERRMETYLYFDMNEDIHLGELSMGQKKKAFMCFALATNTSLLVMDEPSNGLDIPSKSQFRKVIASGMTDEKSVIISTHQVRDIDSLLDHVVIIDGTRVLLNASVKTICDKVYFAEQGMNEPTDTALYVQPSVQGNSVIFPNTENEETNLNLEVLFNAMLAEREKMQTMFNK